MSEMRAYNLKYYDAQFLNRFETVPNGTRYTVIADISLKGIVKYLEPFLDRYIREKIISLVLEPVKQAAEKQLRLTYKVTDSLDNDFSHTI